MLPLCWTDPLQASSYRLPSHAHHHQVRKPPPLHDLGVHTLIGKAEPIGGGGPWPSLPPPPDPGRGRASVWSSLLLGKGKEAGECLLTAVKWWGTGRGTRLSLRQGNALSLFLFRIQDTSLGGKCRPLTPADLL